MNGSGVHPHRLLEATEVSSRDVQLHVLVEMTQTLRTQTGDHYLVLNENGTPNLANIGVIASIILILVVDLYSAANDPRPQMIPRPETIPNLK